MNLECTIFNVINLKVLRSIEIQISDNDDYTYNDYMLFISIMHILSAILTGIFIFYDSLCCCCCTCWLGSGETRVFDPDHPEARMYTLLN